MHIDCSDQPDSVYQTHLESFETDNDIIKELDTGSSAVVYASICTAVADKILAAYDNGSLTRRQTFMRLRSSLRGCEDRQQ